MSFFLPRKRTKTKTKTPSSTKHTETKNSNPHKKAKTTPTSDPWKETECGSLLYLPNHKLNTTPTNTTPTTTIQIAGFDIDHTLIRTKSGKTFATDDRTDWKLWAQPQHIQPAFSKLMANHYHIVFFTNQEGISKGKVNKTKWKQKIQDVIEALGLSEYGVTVLASLSKNNDYRKPHVGMWKFYTDTLLSPATNTVDCHQSLYVGDAAGRPKRGTLPKDFSCSDYKFALNIGVPFQTPEQIFYSSTKPSDLASLSTSNMGFQPKVHWKECYERDEDDVVDREREEFLDSCQRREVVVIVGCPASGKSELSRRIVQRAAAASPPTTTTTTRTDNDNDNDTNTVEYVRINQDTLKTLTKCLKATTQALSDHKSVVIDNTNRDVQTRSKYIALARTHNVPVRCVYLKTTKEVIFHTNALRGAVGDTEGMDQRTVPNVVIHSFFKGVEEPDVKEGFEEVVELGFVPGPFGSRERKEAFFRYTH